MVIINNQIEYDNNNIKNIYSKDNYIYLKNKVIDFLGNNNNQKNVIYHRKFINDNNFNENGFYKDKINKIYIKKSK